MRAGLPRRHPSLLWLIAPVGIALLMVSSPAVGVGSLASGPTASTPASHAPAIVLHPGTQTVTARPVLAGESGRNPSATSEVNYAQLSIASRAAQQAAAPAAGGTAQSPPNPSQNYIPTGVFQGYVANATNPTDMLSGISVQAFPEQGGQFCPDATPYCVAVATGPNGEYNVTCPAGQSFVTFGAPFWAVNQTYATCQLNQTVSIGTIYLLHDAIVTGRVLQNIGSHPGFGAVIVTGSTRDSSIVASPVVTTNSSGYFTVPIPPLIASRVDFQPPSANFQQNYTFAQGAPWQTINIGVVYLEAAALVKAKLYDAVTGAAIDGSYQFPDSLTVCSSTTNVCGLQGNPATTSNIVEAVGVPGWDYVQAVAFGYVVNDTPIGYVPGSTPNSPYCVPNNCAIFLMPMGQFRVTVDIQGSASPRYGTGLWTITDSGLDAYQIGLNKLNPVTYTYNTSTATSITEGCAGVGDTVVLTAFPLRNQINLAPDTTGLCTGFPTWPIPSLLPVFDNYTSFNATPDETTNIGYLNFTPGSYLEGSVYVTGTSHAPPGGFEVQAKSRISGTPTVYKFDQGTVVPGCPDTSTTFCVPAPPGPVQLQVSGSGFPDNVTWASVPWVCCSSQNGPELLSNLTVPSVASINVTLQPTVNGSVVVAGGSEKLPFASIKVCPADPNSPLGCGEGVVNRSGEFSVHQSPPGWDNVLASANGYASNSEWVYVPNGGNFTAPPLPLTPLATLQGWVNSTGGSVIIDASISYCTIVQGLSGTCNVRLGSGLTTSGGYYQGQVPGGWLPGSTYEIEASAPGYQSDWTWVNATANATTTVRNLNLVPLGSGAVVPDQAGHAFVQAAGAWLEGRLVDNSTGIGIDGATLTACPVAQGTCNQLSDPTNTGGFFNGSVPVGVYNLTVGAAGYFPATVLVTIPPGVPSINLGTIRVDPYPWVFGRVVIDPWTTTRVVYGGINVTVWLEPAATVLGCGLYCGVATPDATGGEFQVQTYPGLTDSVTATPIFGGGGGSANGGFVTIAEVANISRGETNLTPAIALPIFATIVGTIYNNASCSPGFGGPICSDPAAWASVQVTTAGVNNGGATVTASPGGQYVVFMPGGNDAGATNITVSAPSYYYTYVEPVEAELGPGQNLTWLASPIELTQFGFAYGTVIDSSTLLPVAGLGVSATFTDPVNGRYGSTNGNTNGGGFINLTAPSGASVDFTLGGAQGYNVTNLSAGVPIGGAVNLGDNWGVGGDNPIPVPALGWVHGPQWNYSAPLGFAGVILDRAMNLPLPGASAKVVSPDPAFQGAPSLVSNAQGEFLALAPIGPKDHLIVTTGAYVENISVPLNITAGASYTVPVVKLTGDGILASRVLAAPSDTPVAGAQVQACVGTGVTATCTLTTTNSSGVYWMPVAPGQVSITVSVTGYVSNYTETVTAVSDTWTAIPAYLVVQDGTLIGTVRGTPDGLVVPGAAVAACSPLGGTLTGPCNFQVATLANGTFRLPVAPGQYIVTASATDYNTSYQPVSVRPGEVVNLGNLPIGEYGVVAGTVIDGASGLAIGGAVVGGCPVDPLLPCAAPTVTDRNGNYRLSFSPGEVQVVASDLGYSDGYANAKSLSGKTVPVATIVINPIGPQTVVHVTGTVVAAGGGNLPIVGATVGLWAGQTIAASTVTGATGAFDLNPISGTYTLVVTAPGYAGSSATLVALESISHLVETLSPFGWAVTGVVDDALTHAPIVGVAIWSNQSILAVTGADGTFAAALPNGSYALTAIDSGPTAGWYGPVSFEVDVAAAPASRSVAMYPGSVPISGTVVIAANGTPLNGATIAATGIAIDGHSVPYSATTDANGRFSFSAYRGIYSLAVSAPGYRTVTLAVNATVAAVPLTVSLSALPSAAGGSGSTAAWMYVAAGVVLVAAAVGAVALLARRGRSGGNP